MQGQVLFFSLWQASIETFYMVAISTFIAVFLGLPLGLLLVVAAPGNILDNPPLYKVLSTFVNTGRS